MEPDVIQYEFVNAETDNVIGYLSLPANMAKDERQAELEKKQSELAMTNAIYFEAVYWRKS